MNAPAEDRLLTPGEVAKLFRVDPKTVTRWAAAGRIPSVRTPGGHRRFYEVGRPRLHREGRAAVIVTVTPTLGDGTVVRWYETEADAANNAIQPLVSASRNGVLVSTYLHVVPTEVMEAAQTVYVNLRRDPDTDMGYLATHRRRGLFGPLEPVQADRRRQ